MTNSNPQATSRMDEYHNTMDSLKFSDEAKGRMAARLAEAATREEAGPAAPAAARRKRRLPFAAAVAGIALALAVGGVAYATGGLVSLDQFAGHLFDGEAKVEVVNKVGHPVGVASSDNGVTVSADAIIGDRRNVAVIFSISKDDGSAFEGIETVGDGLLSLGFAKEDVAVSMPLLTPYGMAGQAYFYDEDPTDNAIQYVTMSSYLDLDDDFSLVGRTMTVKLGNLRSYAEGYEEPPTVAEGSWKLTIPLEYEDASVALQAGQSFDLNGMDATIDSLTISPIGLNMSYTAHDDRTFEPQESGQESKANAALRSELLTPSYTIGMKDGSSFELENRGGGLANPGEGGASCEQGVFFNHIIDLEDVASVTVGGTTIEL